MTFETEKAVHEAEAMQSLAQLRSEIRDKVGDTESILGTTADASQILLLFMLIDHMALAGAATFEAYKAARLAQIDAITDLDLSAKAADILSKLAEGEYAVTAQVKEGEVGAVIDEAFGRATGVVQILTGI